MKSRDVPCVVCGKFVGDGCKITFYDFELMGEGYGEYFEFCSEHGKPIANFLKQYLLETFSLSDELITIVHKAVKNEKKWG